MNETIDNLIPPTESVNDGHGSSVIALRMDVPAAIPADDLIGTQLLSRVLQLQMEADGLEVHVSMGLPLHRAVVLLTLRSDKFIKQGLGTVKSELERLDLLEFSKIAVFDSRVNVWRLHYPETGTFKMPSVQEIKAEKRRLADRIRQAKGLNPE